MEALFIYPTKMRGFCADFMFSAMFSGNKLPSHLLFYFVNNDFYHTHAIWTLFILKNIAVGITLYFGKNVFHFLLWFWFIFFNGTFRKKFKLFDRIKAVETFCKFQEHYWSNLFFEEKMAISFHILSVCITFCLMYDVLICRLLGNKCLLKQ